ncbi:hypothetical protein GIB67_037696 [Kingdonia uniflora]|uniref:Uncharacterized protein n=2 Tax=Magnoliopsida TaxID=3398 RepID=A0A7J7MGP2_9MAGN|nr:hypothetical protein GIB67_037696 [Kingdonia uniflora]
MQDKVARLIPVSSSQRTRISFDDCDVRYVNYPHHDALVIMLKIRNMVLHTMMVDTGSTIELLFQSTIDQMGLANKVQPSDVNIYGFNRSREERVGKIVLPITAGPVCIHSLVSLQIDSEQIKGKLSKYLLSKLLKDHQEPCRGNSDVAFKKWILDDMALEGYGAVHEPDFRGDSFGGRRFLDEGFSRENIYPRSVFHRELVERDDYLPPPSVGAWSQPRRRNYDDEFPVVRETRRHEKPYIESYNELDGFHGADKHIDIDAFEEADRFRDSYRGMDNYGDHGFDRLARFGGRDRDDFMIDGFEHRLRISHRSRESSREKDYDYGRASYDSDYNRGSRRETSWRRPESRDRDRDRDKSCFSRERDRSPPKRYDRSWSRGREERQRSRSPRGHSYRSHREESYDGSRHERSEKSTDHDERRSHEHSSVTPSATVVVKGLSQKTNEEDLCQILAEWGPLRHVRVIKERSSGISRGFAFIDFPSVVSTVPAYLKISFSTQVPQLKKVTVIMQGAARSMIDGIGENGLVVDGRKLFFDYSSSKPTGGSSASLYGHDNGGRSSHGNHKTTAPPSDWMCVICGCVNFARRTSCFQCNEPRSDDAPAADVSSSNPTSLGKRGLESGPTHVLVVRGLEDNADEDMLRYEFSKHAPIKDLRLVRDKFTHVTRGFAFIHFHAVEDAMRAFEATNGTTLEKNGQVLRVAYAKSIHGPPPGASGLSNSSSLAAAAIEAAAFSQQYDAVGWAPKEYNPDEKQSANGQHQGNSEHSAPQSGFVWDEASGYYYDAASGFYYDGNTASITAVHSAFEAVVVGKFRTMTARTSRAWFLNTFPHPPVPGFPREAPHPIFTVPLGGLYYDGRNGTWYSYDHQTQQYVPCVDQNDNKATPVKSTNEPSKAPDSRKVVISAPAATITIEKEKASLPDAVQAAATAALAAEKKEKERMKEIRLASKSSILANKKKMSNVLTMWKQRNHEGQAARVVLNDNPLPSISIDDRTSSVKKQFKADTVIAKEVPAQLVTMESPVKSRPLMGVIRGSGKGVVKSDKVYSGSFSDGVSTPTAVISSSGNLEPVVVTPFRTDLSALGSYTSAVPSGSGKRRFSEMPVHTSSHKEQQSQSTYRDRAAERRSLYGSSSVGDEFALGDSNRDVGNRRGSLLEMPFPPGVGGGRGLAAEVNVQNYEVITADRAIDESNVGNRMLRGMGWQEGLGLGKDGSGITEPVQAQGKEDRSGLGVQQRKVDSDLEVQAGDSYRTLIQKKALARFREMA